MDDKETDFEGLLAGTSPEEAKRLWRILSEWCEGDENSFPVHLALLTRAQWRAAAAIPPLVNDSVKLMELKLSEYRQQTMAMVKSFGVTIDGKAKELENTIKVQTDAMNQAVAKVESRLFDAKIAAGMIRRQLEDGVTEWEKAKTDFESEREKLEQKSKEVERRLKKNEWYWLIFILACFIGFGIVIGIRIAH